MNYTWFGVADFKFLINTVFVCFIYKFFVKYKNVISQMQGKFRYILPFSFATQKFTPRDKQVLNRDDIIIFMRKPVSLSLSLDSASIIQRVKEGYLVWINIVPHIPKSARYTIGTRIENKFLDLLELTYIAYFTEKEKKSDKLSECILVLDTLKFFLTVAWEAKLISNNQFEDIVRKLEEVGRMLGGWKKNLDSPKKKNPA